MHCGRAGSRLAVYGPGCGNLRRDAEFEEKKVSLLMRLLTATRGSGGVQSEEFCGPVRGVSLFYKRQQGSFLWVWLRHCEAECRVWREGSERACWFAVGDKRRYGDAK